jgi:formate dehydrogenase major subunit
MSNGKSTSRRDFLKRSTKGAATTAATTAAVVAGSEQIAHAEAVPKPLKTAHTTQTTSICPYCAVGCSVVVHTLGDKARNVKPAIVHIEGDPESPINRGTLCPKGASLEEFVQSDRRLTKVLYKAPSAKDWQPLSWSEAIPKMARRIKESRDKAFVEKDEQGRTVNRLQNIAMIGGCTDTNEINYLLSKFRFSLGLLAYENQSRL